MLFSPGQHPDVRHPGQVRRIETADGATPDDADTLHAFEPTRRSTFTKSAVCPISPLSARNRLSGLLNESSINTPFSNKASCSAAEIVWIGAAPPSPIPFAPL